MVVTKKVDVDALSRELLVVKHPVHLLLLVAKKNAQFASLTLKRRNCSIKNAQNSCLALAHIFL